MYLVSAFSIRKKNRFVLCALIYCLSNWAQTDSKTVFNFSFNDHEIKEDNEKIKVKPVGISLADDRFGNKESAVFLHGHAASYLNLGTSSLLKPKVGTISIWVNLDRIVYAGKGYLSNPIIETKNGPGDDFIIAYLMSYDSYSKRFASCSTKDSTKEAFVCSTNETLFGKWYHLAITYDNDFFTFYVNGKIQQKYAKGFEVQFLKGDSVMVGNTANKKNDRWSQGTFDDIQIFHRVLNENEVKELYESPNPNRTKIIIDYVLIGLSIIALIVLVAYYLK